jgi:hypothetical protein
MSIVHESKTTCTQHLGQSRIYRVHSQAEQQRSQGVALPHSVLRPDERIIIAGRRRCRAIPTLHHQQAWLTVPKGYHAPAWRQVVDGVGGT